MSLKLPHVGNLWVAHYHRLAMLVQVVQCTRRQTYFKFPVWFGKKNNISCSFLYSENPAPNPGIGTWGFLECRGKLTSEHLFLMCFSPLWIVSATLTSHSSAKQRDWVLMQELSAFQELGFFLHWDEIMTILLDLLSIAWKLRHLPWMQPTQHQDCPEHCQEQLWALMSRAHPARYTHCNLLIIKMCPFLGV